MAIPGTVTPRVPIATHSARQQDQGDHLARRLVRALFDLGLDQVLPGGWVSSSCEGLTFGQLTLRQADRLILVLEDVAAEYEPESPEPGPGQLSLFDVSQR